jgi:hypothetical protein
MPPDDAATPQIDRIERERLREQKSVAISAEELARADARWRASTNATLALDPVGVRFDPERHRLHNRVDSDFTYHAPKVGQSELYGAIRELARDFAHQIVELTPVGREQSTALTKLEEAVFHANAAIARHG